MHIIVLFYNIILKVPEVFKNPQNHILKNFNNSFPNVAQTQLRVVSLYTRQMYWFNFSKGTSGPPQKIKIKILPVSD